MDSYLITKTLHIFCVLVWIGGVMMNATVLATFKLAPESLNQSALLRFHNLDRWLINPVQGLAWLLGLGLIFMGGWFPDNWLIAKLVCVIFVSALHGVQSAALRKAARGQETQQRLAIAQRLAYVAFPIVLVIVFLVVNKPF